MISEKAAIYCRLSTEDTDKPSIGDDSESIQNQKLLLMDFCMNHNFAIHKIYSDDDYSGLDRMRPGFNQMIKDAESGLFNIIVCKTQSRFTRDMEMVEKYIHGLFILWGIRFIGVVDNVDTSVKGNKKSRQINALINEWYCEDLSENIRTVFKKKMKDGQFIGSFAPYGYMKSPEDRHKLVIDEEAAGVVREIYALYLQGYGCASISSILTDKGILTPSAYKNSKELNFKNPNSTNYSESFGIWSHNTIKRILRNETYIGKLIQGRERKVSYKSNKVVIAPKEEWIIVDSNHEPIIDEAAFQTVQSLMNKKRKIYMPVDGYKGTESAHILAGKVICLDCGSPLHRGGTGRDGTTHYLRCKLAYKTKNKECTPHSVKLNQLVQIAEERIRGQISMYLENEKKSAEVLELINTKNQNKNDKSLKEKELKLSEAKLQDILNALAYAYTDKVRGSITESEFYSFKQIYGTEIERLKSRINCLKGELNEMEHLFQPVMNTSEFLSKCSPFKILTHEIINDFIDNILVSEKDECGRQTVIINWLF